MLARSGDRLDRALIRETELDTDRPEISIVLPCLNEEETIGRCIEKAQWALRRNRLRGEIIVADNGSTDGSAEICRGYGVQVVNQSKRGYGNAYLAGIGAARGRYIIIADSDDTYDLREIERFVEPLRNGYDLVMGNRFKGEIRPGAMTWSHRYIGNPILSGILRLMFSTDVGDAHTGIRAFTADAFRRMHPSAPGMEFASEMVINAARAKLKIAEIPITYYPRDGESKLRTVRDGWRHLCYMLLRSPFHLFIVPGLILLLVGMAALVPFLWGPVTIGGRPFDIHVMFLAGVVALLGYQVLSLGVYAQIHAVRAGVDAPDNLLRAIRARFSLERGLAAGFALFALGVALGGLVVARWLSSGFGAMSLTDTRWSFFALIVIVLGTQTAFSSFYLTGVLGDQYDRGGDDPW